MLTYGHARMLLFSDPNWGSERLWDRKVTSAVPQMNPDLFWYLTLDCFFLYASHFTRVDKERLTQWARATFTGRVMLIDSDR